MTRSNLHFQMSDDRIQVIVDGSSFFIETEKHVSDDFFGAVIMREGKLVDVVNSCDTELGVVVKALARIDEFISSQE